MLDEMDVYGSIYKDIFCSTFNQSCYVFLCGGAGKEHIRNTIRPLLEKEKFQILYPEDLFMDMLNRNKKSDLLEYENLLAENSDIVCIICESIGSAVELGAFVQNESMRKKMVAAINKKYSRDKSFVMMGPVKHLRKANPQQIILYNVEEPENLKQDLTRTFRQLHKKPISNKEQSFDKLAAYIGFIPLIIYFYQSLGRSVLHRNLKKYLKSKDLLPDRYNELFNASIKYLMKSGILVNEFNVNLKEETFSLSPKGYNETLNLLKRSYAADRTMLHDKIRCAILMEQLKISRSF